MTMNEQNNIALPIASRDLAELTGKSVSYSRLYKAVLDGTVPAERVGSRWFLRRADLPVVAGILGLTIRTDRVAA